MISLPGSRAGSCGGIAHSHKCQTDCCQSSKCGNGLAMVFVADNQSAEKISKPKILVVDDDELNQRMMQVLLKREGYQVDLASNGQEALEIIKLHHYDVVFMDLQMPVMDGI